uniref:Putative secreted protein n=1 Tax=Anopheles triannulatus TaxID=58253 RepID=A0A2M4B798_9DIPT
MPFFLFLPFLWFFLRRSLRKPNKRHHRTLALVVVAASGRISAQGKCAPPPCVLRFPLFQIYSGNNIALTVCRGGTGRLVGGMNCFFPAWLIEN